MEVLAPGMDGPRPDDCGWPFATSDLGLGRQRRQPSIAIRAIAKARTRKLCSEAVTAFFMPTDTGFMLRQNLCCGASDEPRPRPSMAPFAAHNFCNGPGLVNPFRRAFFLAFLLFSFPFLSFCCFHPAAGCTLLYGVGAGPPPDGV
jgi:hypothetical protein